MSTGPHHYILAEELLDQADTAADKGYGDEGNWLSVRAQAHATLALAAATALCNGQDGELDDYLAWEKAAGEWSAKRNAEQADDEAERAL